MRNAMTTGTTRDLHPMASISVALWLLSTLLYYHFWSCTSFCTLQ